MKIWIVRFGKQFFWPIAAALVWGGFFTYLWPNIFYRDDQGVWAGSPNVWADWAMHLTLINSMVTRHITEWFTYHPLFVGKSFSYPFLSSAISALVIRMGGEWVTTVMYCSLITTYLLIIMLYLFYSKTLANRAQAFWALCLFFMSGGFGFLVFFRNILEGRTMNLPTFIRTEYTNIFNNASEMINIVTAELLPQRAFLLGIPLSLMFILTLRTLEQRNFKGVKWWHCYLLGLSTAVIFVTHVHSFLACAIYGMTMFIYKPKRLKHWCWIALGALIPFLLLQNSLYSAPDQSFIQWYPGGLVNSAEQKSISFAFFIVWNFGVLLVCALFGIIKFKLYRDPIVMGSLAIFIICLLFKFQPWAWDNTKLFTWAIIGLIIPWIRVIAAAVSHRRYSIKLIGITLFLAGTLSGGFDLSRLILPPRMRYLMWDEETIQLSQNFSKISQPNDLVLTFSDPLQWVSCLTGRRIVMGYQGWLYAHGIDYKTVANDVRIMFAGGDASLPLLKKYGVSFVVFDDNAAKEFQTNETFYRKNFPLALTSSRSRIYKINEYNK